MHNMLIIALYWLSNAFLMFCDLPVMAHILGLCNIIYENKETKFLFFFRQFSPFVFAGIHSWIMMTVIFRAKIFS